MRAVRVPACVAGWSCSGRASICDRPPHHHADAHGSFLPHMRGFTPIFKQSLGWEERIIARSAPISPNLRGASLSSARNGPR